MNHEEFDNIYADFKEEHDEYGIRNTAALDDAGIRRAESDLGAQFPDDYRWFLENYWTGMFGAVDLYTMEASDRSYIADRQPPGVSGQYVAVADDGFGNAFCFPIFEGKCRDEIIIIPLLATEFTGNVEYQGFLEFLSQNA
ncbi:hypothetical protein BKG69_17405 [Mycobacteroides chelonae]|uniref:SMI1/KNR4 family protein n=1 Tax=Mycobacteroides chelonae TaxID=1774 RepID=UPI0008A93AC9|nr:SMI1/KNR4 family protein [Mycobacteroides chelonae]OHT77568.1 hypothetical protein BKG69_17405 [Mycobacteroides chelonae]GLE56382.1 hypothetical protein NJBCHELONAE_16910 [Mycobacteroides chelonae]